LKTGNFDCPKYDPNGLVPLVKMMVRQANVPTQIAFLPVVPPSAAQQEG